MMTARVQGPSWFDQVKGYGARVVAESLGLVVDAAPRRGIRPCPSCGAEKRGSGDRRAPAELTSDGGGWHCFRCEAKGDTVSLAAVVATGDAKPNTTAWPEVRRRCAAAGLCDPDPRDTNSPGPGRAFRRPPPPPAPVEAPPLRPPPAEVLELWERCATVTADAEASAWLRSRELDPGEVAARDLARALPVAGTLPRWARYRGPGCDDGASWRDAPQRFRIVVPMFGAGGSLESLHVRALAPTDPKGRDKAAAPAGFQVRGLVFADALARSMLGGAPLGDGSPAAELVKRAGLVVAEGEPDFLTWATRWSETAEAAPAVLGIVAGSWSAELAARVPDGARVALWTDPDRDGDRYAEAIRTTLAGRCAIVRRRLEVNP